MPLIYQPENLTRSLCQQARPDPVVAPRDKRQYLKDLLQFVLQFCCVETDD